MAENSYFIITTKVAIANFSLTYNFKGQVENERRNILGSRNIAINLVLVFRQVVRYIIEKHRSLGSVRSRRKSMGFLCLVRTKNVSKVKDKETIGIGVVGTKKISVKTISSLLGKACSKVGSKRVETFFFILIFRRVGI